MPTPVIKSIAEARRNNRDPESSLISLQIRSIPVFDATQAQFLISAIKFPKHSPSGPCQCLLIVLECASVSFNMSKAPVCFGELQHEERDREPDYPRMNRKGNLQKR
ncbi:hypothetical protein SAY87_003616 [Trapa incisa]|uniref:Uncharacterized protein n=1 Tax=Trapa incisa TaxID=236973 RepID=A0AAN7KRP5_9MYRT|nr:hypothetical protein SAY87_003616 [Trapa incisa]